MKVFFGQVEGDVMVELRRSEQGALIGVDIHKAGQVVRFTPVEWAELTALAGSNLGQFYTRPRSGQY